MRLLVKWSKKCLEGVVYQVYENRKRTAILNNAIYYGLIYFTFENRKSTQIFYEDEKYIFADLVQAQHTRFPFSGHIIQTYLLVLATNDV